MLSRASWLSSLLLAAVFVACSSDDDSSSAGASGSSGSAGSAGSSSTVVCSDDPRAQTYASGMIAKGTTGLFSVALDSIAPNPVAKGNNEWSIRVLDADNNPVSGATLDVKPFMPDHGHGSSIRPQVADKGQGVYAISLLNLFMPGIWQITVTITSSTGSIDSAVFTFCVEG